MEAVSEQDMGIAFNLGLYIYCGPKQRLIKQGTAHVVMGWNVGLLGFLSFGMKSS